MLLATKLGHLKRCFSVGDVQRHFIKDVYKTLEYTAPFNEVQKTTILDKINSVKEPEELTALGVSKIVSRNIVSHLHHQKQFEVLEQILDVNKMDPKRLERTCQAILNSTNQAATDKEILGHKTFSPLKKNISPSLSQDTWDRRVSNFCSLSFNLATISFTLMDKDQEVFEWGTLRLREVTDEHVSFNSHSIYHRVSNVVDGLPKADLVIYEESPYILPNDTLVQPKCNLLQIQTSLLSVLSERMKPDHLVFGMKRRVLDTMFNLKIGQKRMGVRQTMESMALKRTDVAHHEYAVTMRPKMRDLYVNQPVSQIKEQMSTSLMIGLAVNQLMKPR